MAPERKEVVVDADPLQPQNLGKQRAQHLLLRRARRPPNRRRDRLRRRQRTPVELAVGRQRKPLQHHKRRRNHVVRKAPTQMRPQPRSIRHAPPAAPPPHRPTSRLPAAPSSRAITAACATPGCRVSAASISPGSIRKPRSFTCASARPRKSRTPSDTPARQIPGAVHPAPGSPERVRNEPLRRQPGTPQIAARQTRTGICKARPQPRPEQAASRRPARKPACSRSDGQSDCRRSLAAIAIKLMMADMHRRLGRAVDIDQTRARSRCSAYHRRSARSSASPPKITCRKQAASAARMLGSACISW